MFTPCNVHQTFLLQYYAFSRVRDTHQNRVEENQKSRTVVTFGKWICVPACFIEFSVLIQA